VKVGRCDDLSLVEDRHERVADDRGSDEFAFVLVRLALLGV
jgi:hypothetical protein